MKLWIGAEIQSDIVDTFREARKEVEKSINEVIESRNYDISLESWDCIAIIRDDNNLSEVTKYSKKKQDMDYRLSINYYAFVESDHLGKVKLIFDMLIRSLLVLKEKHLNKDLGIDQLIADVEAIGVEKGWLKSQ